MEHAAAARQPALRIGKGGKCGRQRKSNDSKGRRLLRRYRHTAIFHDTGRIMEYAELHAAISNARRIQVISDYPLLRVITAPGHHALRNPASVEWIAQAIDEGRFEEVFAEPILIGIFTDVDHGSVRLRAIECLDGHHRLLAGLQTGAWRVIGDIPEAGLDTRVNGWRADGTQAEPRWIPLEVAQRSRLAKADWSIVPLEWGAKGPTAMIPGEVCGLDSVFSASDRSIPFQDLVGSAKR